MMLDNALLDPILLEADEDLDPTSNPAVLPDGDDDLLPLGDDTVAPVVPHDDDADDEEDSTDDSDM